MKKLDNSTVARMRDFAHALIDPVHARIAIAPSGPKRVTGSAVARWPRDQTATSI
jgi:hypothetical protein